MLLQFGAGVTIVVLTVVITIKNGLFAVILLLFVWLFAVLVLVLIVVVIVIFIVIVRMSRPSRDAAHRPWQQHVQTVQTVSKLLCHNYL